MNFPKVPGVILDIRKTESERVFVLQLISVPKAKRGTGLGSQAMRTVLDWADDNGFIIALSPTDEFGTPKSRLVNWYGGFGFMPNAGRQRVEATREKMIRYPHGGLRDLLKYRQT